MHLFAEKKYLPNHRMAQSIEWETAKLRNTEVKKIPAVRPAWATSSGVIQDSANTAKQKTSQSKSQTI